MVTNGCTISYHEKGCSEEPEMEQKQETIRAQPDRIAHIPADPKPFWACLSLLERPLSVP
jgi:hypothetical protein